MTIKLLLSFFQILSAVIVFSSFEFPKSSSNFFDMFNFFPYQTAASLVKCGGIVTFSPIEVTTISVLFTPIFFFIILLIVVGFIKSQYVDIDQDETNLRKNKVMLYTRSIKILIWGSLASYPLISNRLLELFRCRDLGATGLFVTRDYSMSCTGSKYAAYASYAALGIIFYIIGVPVFFFLIISGRNKSDVFKNSSEILWKDVHPEWCYFEVMNLVRKVMLTSVAIFIYDGQSSQFVFLLIINNCFLIFLSYFKPYRLHGDNILAITIATTENFIILFALLVESKVTVVDNYSSSMYYFMLFLVIQIIFFLSPLFFMIKFKYVRKRSFLFKWLYDGKWDIQTLNNHSKENTMVDKKEEEKSVLSKTYKLIYKICISACGNIVLFYNFSLFGGFSDVLVAEFFPDKTVHTLLLSTVIFGIAFIFRPIGGVIATRLNHKYTRKAVIEIFMRVMSCCTFLIGCLPNYNTMGVLAPILLISLRSIQGIAAGGELLAAIIYAVEEAKKEELGFWVSICACGIYMGILLCYIFVTIVRNTQSGWRIPFLLSPLITTIGLYSRRQFMSLNTDLALKVSSKTEGIYKELFNFHWRKVFLFFF